MKEIKLTQGKFAQVDDSDYDFLNQFKWYAQKDRRTYYAVRRNGNKRDKMHRVILNLNYDDNRLPDHLDGDGLNNQRYNLRIADHSQNCANRKSLQISISKYKGVSPSKKRWRADITKDGVHKYIGSFKNEVDAALAYNNEAKRLHGEFAQLNEV